MRDRWTLIALLEQIRKGQGISTYEESLSYGWVLRKLAQSGCLSTAKIGSEGLVNPRMIVDLNDYEFEELFAPY
jgi:hypothetical protein